MGCSPILRARAAPARKASIAENTDVFTGSPPPDSGTRGISLVGAENSPVRLHSLIGGRLPPGTINGKPFRGCTKWHTREFRIADTSRRRQCSTRMTASLQRTQKLVEIGAASRRELEKIHAEHAAQTANSAECAFAA